MKTIFFTGTGDAGDVSVGHKKHSKNEPCFEVLGLCDELNVFCGNARLSSLEEISKKLLRIQELLFIIQAEIASLIFGGSSVNIKNEHIKELEEMIFWCDEKIPQIKNFIIPGESESSSRLEISRVVARKFERSLIGLEPEYIVSVDLRAFANRLSSVFFAFARYENFKKGIQEKHPEYK